LPRTSFTTGLEIAFRRLSRYSAHRRRAVAELLVDEHAQRGVAHAAASALPAEGAAVVARAERRHHFLAREERGDGNEAAAERLAEDEPVGLDAFVLAREDLARCVPGPSAPRPR
jgi:hypothetical protein